MNKTARIQDCIEHHDEYVLVLAAMPDSRLREKLGTIQLQMDIALRTGDAEALELLELWRAQTIEARTLKAEQQIADAPDEIQEVLAEIETYKAGPPQAKEISSTADAPLRKRPPAPDDKSEQLSIF